MERKHQSTMCVDYQLFFSEAKVELTLQGYFTSTTMPVEVYSTCVKVIVGIVRPTCGSYGHMYFLK